MRAAMLAWSQDGDLWKRRAAILSQCGRKAATDEALLNACIAPNLADHPQGHRLGAPRVRL
jgi:hypothetical protein